MSLLLKGGITKLSELEIDTDKDWQSRGITNLGGVAAGMAIGHVVQRNGGKLQTLAPGPAHTVLTSEGPGHLVVWAPGGTYFERYLPVTVDLEHDEGLIAPDLTKGLTATIASSFARAHGDAPGDMIKRLTPALVLANAEAIVTPDGDHQETPAMGSSFSLKIVVDGAVADDGGVQTDETSAARNPTQNDMTLLPAAPTIDDAYYFGHAKRFDVVWLNIGTQGDGVWVISWEYWNGAAWSALADVVDNTNGFTALVGLRDVSFTRPGDWAAADVGGVSGLYWIRARVSSFTSINTQPRGNQAWVEIYL
jgi:hypothetical protein